MQAPDSREAGRRLQQLLLEGELAVLTALVESLQLEDEGKSSDEVADVLLLFLAHHDKLLPFLKLLVAREALNTENPSTLFRGNSVGSKLLSRYTLQQGEIYLKQGGSPQAAAKLTELCECVISSSESELPNFPLELHELCLHLKEKVVSRFGEKMGLSGVGGYLFLRFICPAMVAPEHYGISMELSKDARRNLMAVSKVIQALANGITSFKEEYMRPMDAFLSAKAGAFAAFLNSVSSLPANLPPPLPSFDSLPSNESQHTLEALSVIHTHLKRNIHKIGSVMQALDSAGGLQSLKVSGERAGWLSKRGGGVVAWKKRWFVLHDTQLMYFNSPGAGVASGRIPLEGTKLEIVTETEFTIVAEYRSFELSAESEAEAKDWVRSIGQAQNKPSSSQQSGSNPVSRSNSVSSDSAPSLVASDEKYDVRGWLKKAGPKGTGWKKRWFILNGNLLVYFKGENDSTPQGEIKMNDARIRTVDATRFNIEVANRTFYLQASSEKEKNDWISTLNSARVHFIKLLANESMLNPSAEWLSSSSNSLSSSQNAKLSDSSVSAKSLLPHLITDMLSEKKMDSAEFYGIESLAITKEGSLFKQGGQIKTWKQRWMVLRGHQLYYYKSAADKEPLGAIPLSNSKITSTDKTSFEILTGKRNFFLRGNTKAEADAWIDALVAAASAVSSADKQIHIAAETAGEKKVENSMKVICEGYLEKEGGKKMAKKWQMRWFVLQGPMLSYYKERGDLQAAGVVPVGNCTVALADENLGRKNAFVISTRYRNYFLVAKDEFELAKWMKHIEQVKVGAKSAGGMTPNMEIFFRLNDVLGSYEK